MFKVSVDDLPRDRYKLRWREYRPVLGADGQPLKKPNGKPEVRPTARSWTVEGKKARDETVADVVAALRQRGTWEPPLAAPVPTVCNLEVAAAGWLGFKQTRCKAPSVARYQQHMGRWFGVLRAARGLTARDVVRGDVLDRDAYLACVRALQEEGLSPATVYGVARSALEMWSWVADDPRAYPGVVAPPRVSKAILPRAQVYRASTAPTVAELDACLRHISANAPSSRRIGIIMRFTGLRIFQVLAIHREDVHLAESLLTVRVGKSEAEDAERRTIPLSSHLIAELRPWLMEVPVGSPLFTASKARPTAAGPKRRSETFATAWTRATVAGQVRERVWNPPNRRKARPEHAFRASLQGFWRMQGVEEAVIDALVGHAPGSTRDRFYAGAELIEKMRVAVGLLPAVDWVGEGASPLREAGGR